MNRPSTRTEPSFETRLRRVVGIVVLSAILLPILTFLVWRISLSMRVKAKLTAIAQAGYPVTLADLERMYYPQIKPGENAAVYFTEVFTRLPWTNAPKAITDFWQNGSRGRRAALFSDETNAILTSILATNEVFLVLLRKTPELEKSRYPIRLDQGLEIALPHLERFGTCEEIVLLDAAVQAHAGQADVAVQDMKAALRLARSLSHEPILSSQSIRRSCHKVINWSLQMVLSEGVLTSAQLLELFQAMQREQNLQSMEHALAGERCSGIYEQQHFFEHAITDDSSGSPDWQIDTNKVSAIASGVFKVTGFLDANLDYYLAIMSEEVSIEKDPYPERLAAAKRLGKRISKSKESSRFDHLYANLLFVNYGRLSEIQAVDNAGLELRLTALAIERFRLANHDQLPAKLSDLVPAFLPSVPMDPFDGQPLRFRKLEKGYVIYSVGPDGTDDGGKEWQPPAKGSNKDAPYDITFTVER